MHAPTSPVQPPVDRGGMLSGLGAYLIWGLLPLYFLLLAHVDAIEVVASRVVFSLLLLAVVVPLAGRIGRLRAAVGNVRLIGTLMVSATLISINWLIYVWAVQNHHVLEASLGYFLNPLVNVLLGVALLGERLNRVQMVAVALAAAGVAILALGAGGGLWISLTLAVTFAFYGLVRKLAPVESIEGLTIETALLTPIALGYLFWLSRGTGLALGSDSFTTVVLILSGIVTAAPLLLFAAAARRLSLTVLGLLQYLAPSLQFIVAIVVLHEPLSTQRLLCFMLIWAGLAIFAGHGVASSTIGRRRVPAVD